MPGSGLIISDTEPAGVVNRYTWMRPMPDGSREWYEPADGGWQLVRTDPAPPSTADIDSAIATHSADDDAHHVLGLTGSRTIGGYRLTFTKGILTGLEAV